MADGWLARILGTEEAAETAPGPAPTRGPGQAMLRAALAEKVLHAWAQNRQQVLLPLTLNLRRMPPGDRALVVQAMVVALAADGGVSAEERGRLDAALRRMGGEAADRDLALAAAARPPDPFALLAAVEAASLAPQAYAASLVVADRRRAVGRAWLDYLAARLALPPEMLARLARRYRG